MKGLSACRFRFCAALLTTMAAAGCQQAFIGIDSAADIAAENCYSYRYGDKLRKINFAEAFDWCHRAARFGDSNSQTLLGELFYLGLGGAKDSRAAGHWFDKAARQGHAHAQYMLHRIYALSGDPAEQQLAAYWLQQARAGAYKLAMQSPAASGATTFSEEQP